MFESNVKKIKNIFKKMLTYVLEYDIILLLLRKSTVDGRIAQLGEHLPYKQEVIGSIPIAPTIYMAR